MNDKDALSAEERYMRLHMQNPGAGEPAFETPGMMQQVWGAPWGVDNDVGRLRKVLMHRPAEEFRAMSTGGRFDAQIQTWIGPDRMWYWKGEQRPDLAKAQAQHDGLTGALRAEGVEVIDLEGALPHLTRSVFTRDTAIIVPGGAVICRFGVDYRRGEELPVTRTLAKLGVPILRTIHATGLMEGGSFLWLDATTAAVSLGHRSNWAGVTQLTDVLETLGIELIVVDNLGYGLHIDGKMVMVDVHKAVGLVHQLPWWFLERLNEMGIEMIYGDSQEGAFGINCLAVRPGVVIISSHAQRTTERLRAAGVEVIPVEYDELHKGGGGIHCSTLPLMRDSV
jgi:N-dimethylarginine dimethylaminohydrolase